jgi:hypothetical protein
MLFELQLGTLIRGSNPYTDGQCKTMHFYPVAPGTIPSPDDAALATALTAVANAFQAAVAAPNDAALQTKVDQAEVAADGKMSLAHIDIGVDNDYQQEYLTWTFKGRPQKVKRALRIRYRYALTKNPQGPYATEHLLIGFAGSNG